MAKTNRIPSDEELALLLNEDEKILWKGVSEPYKVMDKACTGAFIARCLICLVCAVVCIVASLLWAQNMSAGAEAGVVIVLLLIFAYIAFLPFLDRNTIVNRRVCVVTDKRVVVCEGNKTVHGMNRAGLKVKIVESETSGCIHAVFGKAVDLPARKYRLCCLAPRKDGVSEIVASMAFYNVKDSKALRELLVR